MQKNLLVAVNASYSHTCLAVRSINQFVKNKLGDDAVDFVEFTINQPVGEILRGIAQKKPATVLFATYIWNVEIICKIIPDVKKILPDVKIGAGGPEAGFAADIYLKKLSSLDFIFFGEGEETVCDVCTGKNLADVKGIFYRNQADGKTVFTGERELICNLEKLCFAYPELKNPQTVDFNKIYYYESSRGCPYSCAYCMSSLDKRVRFMPLERVYKDLQCFLDAGVPLVKFVDRTYNLQPERYIAIWEYILQHHNGKTMFHFEIEAEYLSEEALQFLQKVPEGVMQFEIGVQSTNKKTLQAVGRSPDVEKLVANVKRIPRTIHQHLDLIAGLPYEDLESFGKSFDDVISLKPDALQLGFLKVLHGTQMEKYAEQNGWKWMENPVYETFSTPYLSYDDMLFLKDIEVVLDAYWNSGVFANTMEYIGRHFGFWKFFCQMVEFGRSKGTFEAPRRETYWFELLSAYTQTDAVISNLLRYDFILRGKQGNYPLWYEHRYNKERHRELLEAEHNQNDDKKTPFNARLEFGHSEYEVFDFDVEKKCPENYPGTFEKLIKY